MSLGTWATQASSGFHRWTYPHAGHRKGIATGGKVSKMIISVVRPVRTGLRFCGHLIRMWFTAGSSPAAFKRTTNLISHLIDSRVASYGTVPNAAPRFGSPWVTASTHRIADGRGGP